MPSPPARLPLDPILYIYIYIYIRVIYTSIPVLSPLRGAHRHPPSLLVRVLRPSSHLTPAVPACTLTNLTPPPSLPRSFLPPPHPAPPSLHPSSAQHFKSPLSLSTSVCVVFLPHFSIRNDRSTFFLFAATGTVGLIDPRLCTQMSYRASSLSLARSLSLSLFRFASQLFVGVNL